LVIWSRGFSRSHLTDSIRATIIDLTYDDISSICSISQADRGDYQNFFVPLVFPHSCHERRTSRPEVRQPSLIGNSAARASVEP